MIYDIAAARWPRYRRPLLVRRQLIDRCFMMLTFSLAYHEPA